jgi:hypothetical protein
MACWTRSPEAGCEAAGGAGNTDVVPHRSVAGYPDNGMKLLAWLTETFIQTFGITRPRPDQQRAAQLVIGGFLLLMILGVAAVTIFLLLQIHAGSAR